MPRTGLKPAEVRKRIVLHAEERIRKFGVEKLRLVDVAGDMGIAHSALYQHFTCKAALTESVTDKWLLHVDTQLESVLTENKPARELIIAWFMKLHRVKKEKVSRDPELFRAFDSAAEENKQCVQSHLKNARKQLSELVARAMKEGRIRKGAVSRTVDILFLSTMAFHFPKLVALGLHSDQRKNLKSVLNAVLDGLRPG